MDTSTISLIIFHKTINWFIKLFPSVLVTCYITIYWLFLIFPWPCNQWLFFATKKPDGSTVPRPWISMSPSSRTLCTGWPGMISWSPDFLERWDLSFISKYQKLTLITDDISYISIHFHILLDSIFGLSRTLGHGSIVEDVLECWKRRNGPLLPRASW